MRRSKACDVFHVAIHMDSSLPRQMAPAMLLRPFMQQEDRAPVCPSSLAIFLEDNDVERLGGLESK